MKERAIAIFLPFKGEVPPSSPFKGEVWRGMGYLSERN
jgi:hypothetical protein